ncbi:FISUMP domain-containing protein [Paraglaciecola sp. Hal342]
MKTVILAIGIFMFTPVLSTASNNGNEMNVAQPATHVTNGVAKGTGMGVARGSGLDADQEVVQDSQGNTYQTVQIGGQIWLAENLRTTTFQDGTKVNTGFIPDDDEKNLLPYGRLYDWHDVVDERNICPPGWRVASDND